MLSEPSCAEQAVLVETFGDVVTAEFACNMHNFVLDLPPNSSALNVVKNKLNVATNYLTYGVDQIIIKKLKAAAEAFKTWLSLINKLLFLLFLSRDFVERRYQDHWAFRIVTNMNCRPWGVDIDGEKSLNYSSIRRCSNCWWLCIQKEIDKTDELIDICWLHYEFVKHFSWLHYEVIRRLFSC